MGRRTAVELLVKSVVVTRREHLTRRRPKSELEAGISKQLFNQSACGGSLGAAWDLDRSTRASSCQLGRSRQELAALEQSHKVSAEQFFKDGEHRAAWKQQ